MSDEAKKKAREYCKRYRNRSTDSLIYPIRPQPILFAENIYIAGYNQGREDALKELEDRERKAFESGFQKGAEAQDAIEASECVFADVTGLFDDYKKEQADE